MKKIKIKKNKLIIYSIVLVLFITLSNAKGYSVSPFSVGVLFALMWCGLYLPAIASEYLIATVISSNKLADIYGAIFSVFILIVVYAIHKRIKKPMNVALVGVYTLIGQAINLYYIYNIGGLFDCLIFTVACILFLYACINIFQVLTLRGWFYKLTLDETICLCVMILVTIFGVAEIYIFDCALYKLLATISVLLCVAVNKRLFSFVVAITIGLSVGIVNLSILPIGEMALIALTANIFSYPQKYRICTTLVLGVVVTYLYFNGINQQIVYSALPVVVGCVGFLIIPNKTIEKLSDKYLTESSELSVRNVVSSTRKSIKHRMSELSLIFGQMQQMHLNLIKQNLGKEQIVAILSQEISKSLCGECKHKVRCYKSLGLSEIATIQKLIEMALTKGKITILDLPSSLAQRCGIVNLLIGKINQLVDNYNQTSKAVADINNVKFLLAEQMGAVSKLLQDLGQEMDRDITFDNSLHNKILNGLLSNNIICSEILIFAEKDSEISVVVIVKGENAYNPAIEKVVSKNFNCKMGVVEIEPTDLSDYYSVKLSKMCGRDVVFGISNITKAGSTSSGDSHTLIRLGNNKYLLALCDGMGSGENAQKMSALTIGLIENFYRAGFDDEFILTNINKLISINNHEAYSTLDLCVLDLSKEIISFIKLGATYGAIKRNNQVEKVETGSLPIGVVGQISPKINHFAVSSQDMIIMVTDGITDAFVEYEDFAEFVNAIVSSNPQVVAQTILDEAIARNGNVAKDDMTVLVARTFLRGNKK